MPRFARVPRLAGHALAALLIAGAALRVIQFALGDAFWLDELALVRNLAGRPWRDVAAGLLFGQSAPRGFLFLEWLIAGQLGWSEYVLRLLPQIAALLSLPLLARLARRLPTREAALWAAGLFALSPILIEYGAHVKPYAIDVAATLLLSALTLAALDPGARGRTHVAAAAAGALLVWLSQSLVIVLAGLGAAWLSALALARNRRAIARATPVWAVWALAAGAAVLVGMRSTTPETREYLFGYWRDGFPPWPPGSLRDAIWPVWTFREMFENRLRLAAPEVWIALAAGGVVSLLRRDRALALVLLGPIAAALLAAAARQYPLGGHLALYLFPSLLLLAAQGIAAMRMRWDLWRRPAGTVAAGIVGIAPAVALLRYYPSFPREPAPAVLSYVTGRRQTGDRIYVYYGAHQAVGFYGSRYGLPLDSVISGGCHRDEPRAYLAELDFLRGSPRAWFVMSHPVTEEIRLMLGYLDALGTRRDSIVTRPLRSRQTPAAAWLYDLSSPATASAASWPVPSETNPGRPCGGPVRVMFRPAG